MDSELLVDNRTEDGQKLVAELVQAGFDVSVALWVKSEEGLWSLYIGSNSVDAAKIGDAYRLLYTCLSKIPNPSLSMSDVNIIPASDPIAKEAMAIRDRQAGRLPFRNYGQRIGNLYVEEAYIYPRVGGQMTPGEILQTLMGIASGPTGAQKRPTVITLRGGSTITALITGFNLQMPGSLTIYTLDPSSNSMKQIAGDQVVNIQL